MWLYSFLFLLHVDVLVASLLKISGGHMNPAVTVAILVTRSIGLIKGIIYIITQVIASIVACAILWGLTPSSIRGLFCTTHRNLGTHLHQIRTYSLSWFQFLFIIVLNQTVFNLIFCLSLGVLLFERVDLCIYVCM
jgi:aquaporin-4